MMNDPRRREIEVREPVVDFRVDLDAGQAAALLAWGRERGHQTVDFADLVRALIAAATDRGRRSAMPLEDDLPVGSAMPASIAAAHSLRWSALPASSGESRLPARAREDGERSQAFRAAAARILGQPAKTPEAWAFIEPPLDLGDLQGTPPLPPELVRVGSSSLDRNAGDAWTIARGAPPTSADPLPALTNRLAPTFWAAARLVDLSHDEEPLVWRDVLETILPEAWAIGAGLEVWDEEQRRELRREPGQSRKGLAFQASARWPTLNTSARRQASSVASFVMNSVALWRPRRQSFTGPLFTLGLAEAVPGDGGDWRIRPTPAGVAVALRLRFAGASCRYPHDEASWVVIRDCLAWTTTRELARMRGAAGALDEARSMDDYIHGVSEMIRDMDGKPPRGAQAAAQASAHLARLRECGLATITKRSVGPGALTPRGVDLLMHG